MASVDTVRNQNLIEEAFRTTSQRKTGEMGKDQFLNLLVTQLKYQDPLEPVDDKEFIAQLAQFSSLEQMQNMNKTFTEMKAFTLVGKSIQATMETVSGSRRNVEGTVKAVRVTSGKAYAVLESNEEVAVEDITEIREPEKVEQTVNLRDQADLIGRQATAVLKVLDDKEGGIAGIIRKISVRDHAAYAHMDGSIVEVVDIPGGSSETAEEIKNYLDDQEQKYVTVTVLDPLSNIRFEVQGLLRGKPVLQDGKVMAVLDDIVVPVDGITELSLVISSTVDGSDGGQEDEGSDPVEAEPGGTAG